VRAAKLFRLADDQGKAPAQALLGVAYDEGQGVVKDSRQAVVWYRLAADRGDLDGQTLLGLAYYSGKGVPQDLVQAYRWFDVAVAGGNTKAARFLAAAEAKMTPDQIARADRLAHEWKALKEEATPLVPIGETK
jgi:TPR repeat protein